MAHERRRSHARATDPRVEGIEGLLQRVLRWARENHADEEIHGCSACLTDVAIFEDKARELGVQVSP